MTGEELYRLYAESNAEFGCGVDAWEELPEFDRGIWDHFASLLPDMPSRAE